MIAALKGFARYIKKPQNGYTIIEVMLVLAVSTLMLLAAVTVFKGRQADQEYTQAIQDLNSKITNFGSEVSSGLYPASENYSCQEDIQGTPVLVAGTPGTSSLGDRAPCLFLGRAIQVVPGTGTMHFYTILGSKSAISGAVTANPKTIVGESRPAIARLGQDTLAMYETYKIPGGAKIMSSRFVAGGATYGSGIRYDMAGIFGGVSGVSPSSGPSQTMLWGYPIDSSVSANLPANNRLPLGVGTPEFCVRNSCIGIVEAEKWRLCVQNPENNHPFLMTIESAASGLVTTMRDETC